MIHPSWIGLIVVNLTSICRWWGSMPFDNWLVTFEVHQSWYFSEIKFVYTYVDWDVQWLKKIGMVVWLFGTCWTRQLFLSWEVIYFKCSLTFKLVRKEQSLLSFFRFKFSHLFLMKGNTIFLRRVITISSFAQWFWEWVTSKPLGNFTFEWQRLVFPVYVI